MDILHIGMTIVTLRSKKNNYALTAAMISLTLNIDSGFVIQYRIATTRSVSRHDKVEFLSRLFAANEDF